LGVKWGPSLVISRVEVNILFEDWWARPWKSGCSHTCPKGFQLSTGLRDAQREDPLIQRGLIFLHQPHLNPRPRTCAGPKLTSGPPCPLLVRE